MKTISKISAIICTAAFAFGITGCTVKELDTNQYSDSAVTLASFGPNPVMRGAQLRFFGSNLQNITEVSIPGVDVITDIEVISSGKTSEIRVSVPVEGPETGFVSLRTGDGKEFRTRSELSYEEPIVFDSFTAVSPAYPGDLITLKGDYMYLVRSVTFEGGENVSVEDGATRHEAKVVIPATAVTGKIILSDGGEVENLFYSAEDLVIGQPSVNGLAAKKVKVGDKLTFTGQHLEMISTIIFEKGESTETVDDFTLSEDRKSITVGIPAAATDGSFSAVSFAGFEFKAGEIICIMPAEVEAKSTPKAGETLSIYGKDLDVVTRVDLPGAENVPFTLESGSLKAILPAVATEGEAILYHANGSTVSVPFSIVKPVIASVTPAELFAGDSEPIVVKGTDLDLIVKAEMAGKELEIMEQTATEIKLKTAVTSSGGTVVLTLENGTTVESAESVSLKYHSKVIVTSMTAAQHIGQTVVIKGQNMDLIENIFIGEAKVTKYALRTAEEVSFLMPWNKVGSYEVKFLLFDGDTEVQANTMEVKLEQMINVVFEGSAGVNWNNAVTIPFSSIVQGMSIIVEYEVTPADYHMLRVINSDWSFNVDGGDVYNKNFSESGVWEIPVTAELYANLQGKDMSFTGFGADIKKVTLITNISQETTVWEGDVVINDWVNHEGLGSETLFADAGLKEGMEVRFYISGGAAEWKIQLYDGHWGSLSFEECGGTNQFNNTNSDLANGYFSFKATAAHVAALTSIQNWGSFIIIQGEGGMHLTKVCIM